MLSSKIRKKVSKVALSNFEQIQLKIPLLNGLSLLYEVTEVVSTVV